MRRRDFIQIIATSTAWPVTALAQRGDISRIGYLFAFGQAESQRLWQACRDGLGDLGYVEGQNILLEPRWAEGQYQKLPSLVDDLLHLKVDIIVTASTPVSRAAKSATNTTPIVFVAVADPVGVGLVDNLARPGGNVTGFSLQTADLSGKRLALLREIAEKTSRVGILLNPNNESSNAFLAETQSAARQLGVTLQAAEASTSPEIEQAFQSDGLQTVDALIVFDDPALWNNRKQIVALVATRRIPALYGFTEFVDDGGLISYGPDRLDQYRRTSIYVDKILKGAKPSDLPVQQPTKFELFINLKNAKALGLTVPSSLLATADKVIE